MIPLHLSSPVGYAGVALLVGAESAAVPVRGETSLIAVAVLASQGHLSLPIVIAAAAGAAIVGDNVGYAIGRRGVAGCSPGPDDGSAAARACSPGGGVLR